MPEARRNPSFQLRSPGPTGPLCYNKVVMRYEVDLPEEIHERLTERASATGADVAQLIQVAVRHFIQNDAVSARRPDHVLETGEIAAPFDLPRAVPQTPLLVETQQAPRRHPDSLFDSD